MRKRAEQVQETRRRITEAAVRLHTTVGPANTTVSAVAEEAGVTRLTVYKHFPDEEGLFVACTAMWVEAHPPPDAGAWAAVSDPDARLRRALAEQYAWYSANAADLYPIQRDAATFPPGAQEALREEDELIVAVLLARRRLRGARRKRVRAALAHVVSYWTWRSLEVDGGLSTDEAVALACALVEAAAAQPLT